MGVTIHYRGRLDRLDAIEELQDRVLDLALAVGGKARFWFTHAGERPERPVRGLIVDLAPGMEPVSLLFSAEGRLVPLMAIEDAERAPVPAKTWVFVKTQFAPAEAHVALVQLLRFVKERYVSDLEVEDESGYFATRDLGALLRARGTVARGLDLLTKCLRRYPLSVEAAEDADIICARVESIARLVDETLRRAPEHAPVRFDGEASGAADEEALWDAAVKENTRRVERIVERVAREGPQALEEELSARARLEKAARSAEDDEVSEIEVSPELQDLEVAEVGTVAGAEERPSRRDHPLLERAKQLFLAIPDGVDDVGAGLADAMGGFAQALPEVDEDGREADDDDPPCGLAIAQLKRSLRGFAFARGALFLAKDAGTLAAEAAARIAREIDALAEAALERVRELRERPGEEW